MLGIRDVKGKTYIVAGMGRTGISTCLALDVAGARVIAWDDDPVTRGFAKSKGINITDPLLLNDWSAISGLVLSPGIPHIFPESHPFAERAILAGVPIICDIEFLARNPGKARMVGVTGTNGKSTTTALIHHILKEAGIPNQMGGNIGIPVCDLDDPGNEGIYVLELSSYLLERAPSLNLDIAVLTNISPDHLVRHGGMDGYVKAKENIFSCRHKIQTVIASMDDPWSRDIIVGLEKSPNHHVIAVSTMERLSGGIWLDGDILMDEVFGGNAVFSLQEFRNLRGRHNAQNILNAFGTCRALGISAKQIFLAIGRYINLPHRLEITGNSGGIEFINDSKATNPESTSHALAACDNIHWILGGVPKESLLDGLEKFYPRIRHAYLVGAAIEQFANILEGKVPFSKSITLENAVKQAWSRAKKDGCGTILLSPACASFDQFRDFEERGDVFRELTKQILKGEGKES